MENYSCPKQERAARLIFALFATALVVANEVSFGKPPQTRSVAPCAVSWNNKKRCRKRFRLLLAELDAKVKQ